MPRCLSCGEPETLGNALTLYELAHKGRYAGTYRICASCWWHANEPLGIDPLTVSD